MTTWDKEHRKERNFYLKEWRHKKGISVLYREVMGKSYTKEYRKIARQRCKALRRKAGYLKMSTIQLVYEDNIKKYGTLTCIYCITPIQFGQDTLEHRIPLSRGGTHNYNNLAIACKKCNFTKNDKTEQEFMDWRK